MSVFDTFPDDGARDLDKGKIDQFVIGPFENTPFQVGKCAGRSRQSKGLIGTFQVSAFMRSALGMRITESLAESRRNQKSTALIYFFDLVPGAQVDDVVAAEKKTEGALVSVQFGEMFDGVYCVRRAGPIDLAS